MEGRGEGKRKGGERRGKGKGREDFDPQTKNSCCAPEWSVSKSVLLTRT